VDPKNLEPIPLFRDLSRRERDQVARWADEVDVPAGYQLLSHCTFPHEFFAILEGEAEVVHHDEHLADLGPGEFFGEIAIVEQKRRTATVIAKTPVKAIVMHRREFDAMRNELPTVAARIEGAIRERSTAN
jgi:CRP/FNR family cyclic AMP-dependent transcriptional regulator